MSDYEMIMSLYGEYLLRISNNKTYILSISDRDKKIISNFIEHCKSKNIDFGYNFVFYYLAYQFLYWSNKNHKFVDLLPVNYVFGQKALIRYLSKSELDDYYAKEKIIDKYGLERMVLKKTVSKPPVFNAFEDVHKKKFLNQDLGLANCINFTTLWHPDSEVCQACRFVTECKRVLKINYPKLYKERI